MQSSSGSRVRTLLYDVDELLRRERVVIEWRVDESLNEADTELQARKFKKRVSLSEALALGRAASLGGPVTNFNVEAFQNALLDGGFAGLSGCGLSLEEPRGDELRTRLGHTLPGLVLPALPLAPSDSLNCYSDWQKLILKSLHMV